MAGPRPPQYEVEAIRQALVKDPRTAEQGVKVTLRGEHIFLSGEVSSVQNQQALDQVVGEVAPDFTVHNDTTVVNAQAPTGHEDLT